MEGAKYILVYQVACLPWREVPTSNGQRFSKYVSCTNKQTNNQSIKERFFRGFRTAFQDNGPGGIGAISASKMPKSRLTSVVLMATSQLVEGVSTYHLWRSQYIAGKTRLPTSDVSSNENVNRLDKPQVSEIRTMYVCNLREMALTLILQSEVNAATVGKSLFRAHLISGLRRRSHE